MDKMTFGRVVERYLVTDLAAFCVVASFAELSSAKEAIKL